MLGRVAVFFQSVSPPFTLLWHGTPLGKRQQSQAVLGGKIGQLQASNTGKAMGPASVPGSSRASRTLLLVHF